ncbi:sugar ABC transporter ATP-binding protein [Marispirochaeta aestuarii]|uniref:Sugar ABC transporter ATP-binding protein n=1 Tax=Marispirochaeta aestuarii TaxID=1963862 RepID=A0A1Y1S1G1_9SPIO|nr:sugar ABC transporter ATP-binding protein [Marispirochaeta aestuarii]
MANMILDKINKVYPNGVHAVHDFSIDIRDGEFIAFVGPSGCGKSTTLRMIAGLEEISGGDLLLEGKRINDLAPKDRDVAMVFQSYALYPHMTVYHNMAFSLMLRREDPDVIHEKVLEAARILSLEEYLNRKPRELSGGQRQRVALGRAIVRNPKIFLMDEPLSNLDAKLRVQMRSELIKLHKRMNATTVYVTHDQVEAMTMASRIVVMSMGYVQQIGTPKEVYDYPDNMFVAGFIGAPPMNFLKGRADNGTFIVGSTRLAIPGDKYTLLADKGYAGKELVLGVRPEDIHVEGEVMDRHKGAKVSIVVEVAELLGKNVIVYSSIEGKQILADLSTKHEIEMESTIDICLDMDRVHFFDDSTTERIR